MAAAKKAQEPVLSFASVAKWHAWLKAHHASPQAVLLRIEKTTPGAMTYAQALDAALAWGWIDSQKRALDERAWLQRFSRRSAQSPWSKINCDKAEALIAAGAMRAPGLAEVARAKADGRWARAYDGARAAGVPDDLAAALAANGQAKAFFEALDGANRYAILWRVQTAKKPQTRAERIAKLVALCARHETIHPVAKKKTAVAKPRRVAKPRAQ
jgi:uncharacterized protein YdeI (YjbR/CyaY-like superfamily)